MKIKNTHSRTIHQPIEMVTALLPSLATKEDKIWPLEKWPKMYFKEGKTEGAIGGHGPIAYQITKYIPNNLIEFSFLKPKGFKGKHFFEINAINDKKTEVKHTILMEAQGIAILSWVVIIRWLHDALLEDAFDKIESHFLPNSEKNTWSIWVRILRFILK